MSVSNTVETRFAVDVAEYVNGVEKATRELQKFLAANQKGAAEADKKSASPFDKFAKGATNFIKQNQTLGAAAKNLAASIAAINPAAALAVAAITSVAAAAGLATHAAIGFADELNKISLRTGASIEGLSTLGFAAEQSESSLSDLAIGLRNLQRQQVAAAKGNKTAIAAFKELGIESKNLANIPVDKLFRDVAKGVEALGSSARKTAVSAQLLGRFSGPALVPLLNEGEKGIAALEARARELGGEFSGNFVRQADAFGDQLKELKTVSVGFGQIIGTAVLPAITDLVKGFVNAIAPGNALQIKAANLGTQLRIIANDFLFGAAATRKFFAALTKNEAAFNRAEAEMKRLSAASRQAEEDFDKLFQPDKKITPTSDEVETSADAIKSLAEEFKDLSKEGIQPIISLAKEFSESALGGLDPRLLAVIERLRDMTKESQNAAVAGRALTEVLKLQQEAIAKGLEEGPVQGPATREGQGPERVTPESVQEGIARGLAEGPVQGPATREGQGPERATPSGFEVDPGTFGGAEGPVQGPATEEGQEPERLKEQLSLHEQILEAQRKQEEAQSGVNEELAAGQGILAGLTQFANGLGDAIADVFEGNKKAISDFFKGLLKELGRAIIRATILAALMSFIGAGTFSLSSIGKNVQAALGFGPQGFQDRDSSILGRASAAHSLDLESKRGIATPIAAGVAPAFDVQIHEAGPMTWAEITDRRITPRLRERQRRLNEAPL